MTNFTIQLLIGWPWSKFSHAPECSKQPLWVKTDCKLQGSWGVVSRLKYLWNQPQRKHRQRCLKIGTLTWEFVLDGQRQCTGVIFGTPGTVYFCYSLAVSPSVYTVLSPCLSFWLYLSSKHCQLTLHHWLSSILPGVAPQRKLLYQGCFIWQLVVECM